MNLQFYSVSAQTIGARDESVETKTRAPQRVDAEQCNTMPVLLPVPIETKGKPAWEALLTWISSTREWVFASDWDFYLPDTGKTYVIPKGFRFDGASIPKAWRGFLSPVGLLLVPGILHDFGYRYDYIWTRKADGSVEKVHVGSGRKYWDELFFKVGNYVNGVFVINWLARFALALAGGVAWRRNRALVCNELEPEALDSAQADPQARLEKANKQKRLLCKNGC